MGNYSTRWCQWCTEKTTHIKRGFGSPGSLVGNGRWDCLTCSKTKSKEVNKNAKS